MKRYMFSPLTVPELCYMHRFFSAVGAALACRMREGSTPSEDNLTFLLCELMDEGMTSRHVLEYSWSNLQADLDACGTGNRVEISFETNEHTRTFEGQVSYADLGIVFERRHLSGAFRKAVLVQSKRLYHQRDETFGLNSKYEGFHKEQFENLQKLAKRLNAYRGAYYCFYNPDLEGISESEHQKIAAFETSCVPPVAFPHPEWEFFVRRFGVPWGWLPSVGCVQSMGEGKETIDRLREAQRALLRHRPGLRVCGLRTVQKAVERVAQPSLRQFYELRHQHPEPWFDEDCMFESFADFMVSGIVGCASGSDESGLIDVAQGRMPEIEVPEGEESLPKGVGARHTLRIKVTSVLAQEG